MVVCVAPLKIAYMAVPKAACTSIKAALASIDPDVEVDAEKAAEDRMYFHTLYPTQRFRPHRWREFEDCWRFTVVRDPLKRLFSVYTDLVTGRNLLHSSRKLRNQSVLPLVPDPDFFFQHLDRYIAQASAVKHHTLPFRLFIGPPPFLYDRIFRIEDLPELAAKLSEIAGRDVVIPRANRSKTSLSIKDLSPQTVPFIREFLADDYAKLSEFYDNPF